jgi:uncharacterized delta-60 repeat protein
VSRSLFTDDRGALAVVAFALNLLIAACFSASANAAWPNTELVPSANVSFASSAVTPDGEIVVAGYSDYDRPIVARFRPDGSLDPRFGRDGYVVLDRVTETYPTGIAIAVAASGAIVVFAPNDRMQRLTANGEVDRAFGVDGVATLNGSLQPLSSVDRLALDSAGRILVAGSSGEALALERFTADGRPDLSFDEDGMAVASPVPASSLQGQGSFQRGALVAVRADDRLLVLGEAIPDSGVPEIVAAQFNPNGTLDTSFNGDGLSRIPAPAPGGSPQFPSYFAPRAIALDAAGSAVVRLGVEFVLPDLDAPCRGGGSALRLDDDGALDLGFGDNGLAPVDRHTCVSDFALLETGELFAVGVYFEHGGPWNMTETLYTSDGQFGPAFGPHPRESRVAGFSSEATSVARTPSGALLTAGRAFIPHCVTPGFTSCTLGFLLLQRPDGEVVNGFGSHGVTTLPRTRICPDPFELCPYPYRREFKRLARRGVGNKTYLVDGTLRTNLKCRAEVRETCEVRTWFSPPGSDRALAKVRRTSIRDGHILRFRSRHLSREEIDTIARLSHLDVHGVFSAAHQRPVRFKKRVDVRRR